MFGNFMFTVSAEYMACRLLEKRAMTKASLSD